MNKKNVLIAALTALLLLVTAVLLYHINREDKHQMPAPGTQVDLMMFMGQSNMSGTGDSEKAPVVIEGAGYEFKAVSDPTRLYYLKEPFGEKENREEGINDEDLKSGSLVSAFVNSCYSGTQVPIVAVSASAGGSTLNSWRKGGSLLPDAVYRYLTAKEWLLDNGYEIRNQYMVWLQGESDGNKQTSKEDYTAAIKEIVGEMRTNGIEKCFIIRIGIRTAEPGMYDAIIEAQTELCRDNEEFVLISTKAVELEEFGLMRDEVHYSQGGLNLIGEDAGANMAYYIQTGIEPSLYDSQSGGVYNELENPE